MEAPLTLNNTRVRELLFFSKAMMRNMKGKQYRKAFIGKSERILSSRLGTLSQNGSHIYHVLIFMT